jgi:hypothetical protein
MGKYGQLIQQAKAEPAPELENQRSGKPESQTSGVLENQKARKPERQKARKAENQKGRRLEIQTDEEFVNLGVKVPLSWRRHWAAESKRQGVSMTEIIVAALIAEFGKPE